MKNIVLIGAGTWGKNYIKTCLDFPRINLIVANRNNWKNLIDEKPDGAIIATPPDSHVDIALYCLERDIPVIIEKPLALSLNDAKRLEKYSDKILVNHIHLFSYNYQNMKALVDLSKIKEVRTCGTGPVKREYSNLFDYGVHDLSLIFDLLGTNPLEIGSFKVDGWYRIDLKYPEAETHTITGVCSAKERSLSIKTNEFNIYYDDLKKEKLPWTPLHNVIDTFMDYIECDLRDYRMGLDMSFKILETLEKIEKSINE